MIKSIELTIILCVPTIYTWTKGEKILVNHTPTQTGSNHIQGRIRVRSAFARSIAQFPVFNIIH